MTLQLDLTQEEEATVVRAARAQGVSVSEFVRILLGLGVPQTVQLSSAEWDSSLDELADEVSPAIPPLSDESLTRRSIYGHRS